MTLVAVVPYASLVVATKGWSETLGSGAYGTVYGGQLDGLSVAVKRFNDRSDISLASLADELAAASLVRHAAVIRVLAMARAAPRDRP
jgi:hypothetical protein